MISLRIVESPLFKIEFDRIWTNYVKVMSPTRRRALRESRSGEFNAPKRRRPDEARQEMALAPSPLTMGADERLASGLRYRG